jgi:proteasome lid subunit RPN8/RPN11
VGLRVPRPVMDAVGRHLEAGYPSEACGALIGRPGDGTRPHQALEFRPMRNTVTDRPWDRYALDPLEQLRVQKEAEGRGLEIIGFVHSHPDHPPHPSQFDTEHAWPFYSYVVASVAQGKMAEARAWRLDEGTNRFREEPLKIGA